MPAASGNFRQIRITATHELPTSNAPWGRFSVSIYAKPLNVPWTEQHAVMRRAVWAPQMRLETPEEVCLAVTSLLEELYIPRPADTESP